MLSRVNLGEKIGETRVPLYKTGLRAYKVVKILPVTDDRQFDIMIIVWLGLAWPGWAWLGWAWLGWAWL